MKRRSFLAAAAATAAACTTPLFGTSSPRDAVARAQSLTLEQQVGQLMSVAFHGTKVTSAVETMIRQRGVGGILLHAENFEDAAGLRKLCDDLQRIARDAKVPPLFISIDQEGGPVVRIGKGATITPGQMALAATPDPPGAVRKAVAIAAAELPAFGVNCNLAPDADVNDEPRNPIIGNRSFGSDPSRVGALVAEAVNVYRDQKLLCVAKHFPGHGSATVDSHTGLPVIESPRSRLDAVELVPFTAAIAAGVPAIMSAHIVVPALDPTPGLPVTLSRRVMTDLLRGQLGFTGLIVSDDLEMGALATIGEAQAGRRAFEAGVDHLLFRFDESAQSEGHRLIVDAIRSGAIPAARLDDSVGRVVALKVAQGLYDDRARPTPDLAVDQGVALDLTRAGITVLKNDGVLPLKGNVYATAYVGADLSAVPGDNDLATELAAARANVTARRFGAGVDSALIAKIVSEAKDADVAVVGVADTGAKDDQRALATAIAAVRPTVVVSLRSPYDALFVPGAAAYVCAYAGRVPTLRATIEILTGARRPTGRLPVEIPGRYPVGAGLS